MYAVRSGYFRIFCRFQELHNLYSRDSRLFLWCLGIIRMLQLFAWQLLDCSCEHLHSMRFWLHFKLRSCKLHFCTRAKLRARHILVHRHLQPNMHAVHSWHVRIFSGFQELYRLPCRNLRVLYWIFDILHL